MVASLILKKIEDRFILVVVCREGCPVDLFYYMECFFSGFFKDDGYKTEPCFCLIKIRVVHIIKLYRFYLVVHLNNCLQKTKQKSSDRSYIFFRNQIIKELAS